MPRKFPSYYPPVTPEREEMSRRRTTKVVNYSEKIYDESLEEDFDGDGDEDPKPQNQSNSSSASSTQSPAKVPKGEKKTSKQTTPDAATNGAGHDLIPSNWQPRSHPSDALTGVLDLEDAYIKGGKLHLSSGTTYAPGDHCYIVSEPPGEPYYIGRIMDFVINEENPPVTDGKNPDKHWSTLNPRQKYPASQFLFQVNWFYRPKDISKHVADSRLLYATMHSDICSLQSMRGKCVVTHRTDIMDIESYRTKPNHFYFTQFYDRYILRFYEIVPTHTMVNIPKEVSRVLCERFKYAIMEINRKQEFCEAPKECVTCSNWSSPDDSVECAHCRTNFHMMCVTPPLFKKPTRGFGWSCAACNRKVEKRLKEAKGEFFDDVIPDVQPEVKPETSPSMSRSTSPDKHRSRYEELAEAFGKDNSLSDEQKHQLQLWPFRYLGVYAKIEDVLDVDDRIYPRAVSRLGPKHQAVVDSWPGRPVEYIGPFRDAPVKKRGKKKAEDGFNFDPEKPWIQERPIGYIDRGGDETVKLMWDCYAGERAEEKKPMLIEDFLEQCAPHAKKLGVRHDTPNYFDLCLKALMDSKFDPAAALKVVNKLTVKSIDEPVFSAEDKRRFEEGVGKYGSELHPVTLEVGTQTPGHVVRYYYNWKKTPSGRKIWGNYPGRKHKKGGAAEDEKKKKPKVDIGDDSDGSAYDVNKAVRQKKAFECKHCLTTTSPCWKRAPGGGDDEGNQIQALCQRCARLWRRYAIVWEDSDDINRKLIARGGKLWAKKVEAELLEDTRSIIEERQRSCSKKGGRKKSNGAASSVTPVPIPHIPTAREAAAAAAREEKQRAEEERKAEEERDRKARAEAREREKERKEKEDRERRDKERKEKEKRDRERKEREKKQKEEKIKKEDRESKKRSWDAEEQAKKKSKTPTAPTTVLAGCVVAQAYKQKERPGHIFKGDRTPVPPRKKYRRKSLGDACNVCGVSNETEVVSCSGCQVTVHRHCYGVSSDEPMLMTGAWYCDLCTNDAKPNVNTHYQCVLCPIRDNDNEPNGKQYPPEPLKRTEHNHWAHIRCSVWNNKLTYGTPHLEPVLGVAQEVRYSGTGICFICKTGVGACITCRCCGVEYHAGCAYRHNYIFGFELLDESEVRPSYPIVEFNGDKGGMCAVSYCYWHSHQNLILPAEVDQKLGKSALQLFIETYKVDHKWKPRAGEVSMTMQHVYDTHCEPRPPPDVPELNKQCHKCKVGVSPIWRKAEEGDLCNNCFHGKNVEHQDLSIGLPEFAQPMRKLMHFDVLYRSEDAYRNARTLRETQHLNHPPHIPQIHPALENYNNDPMSIRALAETSSI
ncbi:Lid2 complex component snt2 [Yarrowia sp. B02]|nr:Lid2 complex component snt2 [Yarrowia sp. B02]